MKNAEIKDLTTKEIIEKIVEEKDALLKQKMNHAINPLDNPHKMTEKRKFIARLKTELTQREIKADNK